MRYSMFLPAEKLKSQYNRYKEENVMYDISDRYKYIYLANADRKKRAYICSPLYAETYGELISNMEQARMYMSLTMRNYNIPARAPHAYIPTILCDDIPAERSFALEFGKRLLELSDVLFVCGNRLSEGMKGEILHAAELKMPIKVFDQKLYDKVRKYVKSQKKNDSMITFDSSSPELGRKNSIVDITV